MIEVFREILRTEIAQSSMVVSFHFGHHQGRTDHVPVRLLERDHFVCAALGHHSLSTALAGAIAIALAFGAAFPCNVQELAQIRQTRRRLPAAH
jgi:UDP-N-acetylmuramate-alanine ligase